MKKLLKRIEFQEDIYKCGFSPRQLNEMLLYEFDSVQEAADYLGCSVPSIYRFRRTNKWPISVAKLLMIKRRGFLPMTGPWREFRIRGDVLVTPSGREFTAQDLNVPRMITSKDNFALIMRNKKRFRKF